MSPLTAAASRQIHAGRLLVAGKHVVPGVAAATGISLLVEFVDWAGFVPCVSSAD
jgi:hypothetical protein